MWRFTAGRSSCSELVWLLTEFFWPRSVRIRVGRRHVGMALTQTRTGPWHAVSCVVLAYFALLAFLLLAVGQALVFLVKQPTRFGRAGAGRVDRERPERGINQSRIAG
jgi:hypothetical protein